MAPGLAAAIPSVRAEVTVPVAAIVPILDQRRFTAQEFADSRGDFVERTLWLAADVAEDDLLPTFVLAELERVDHRAEPDVPFADRFAGLGVDVAAHEDRRAARHIGQGFEPRNVGEIIVQRGVRIRLAARENGFAKLLHVGSGESHVCYSLSVSVG